MNASALTTRSRPRADQSAAAWRRAERWLGSALIALGAGIAALSLLGPLLTGVIDYRVSGLGFAAIAAFLAAPLVRRQSKAAGLPDDRVSSRAAL
jgi:hypothetical protein